MPWTDRIREAAYISPGGTRTVFIYEDVRQEFDKKTAAFIFPDADGTYVQDLGHSGRRYPFRIFFWGSDYDVVAEEFDRSLRESGIGKLEHPIYGVIDVVPFGAVIRRDNLKTASNQAIFEVSFWETIGLIFPVAQNDPASDVLKAVDGYNVTASQEFEDTLSIASAVEVETFENSYSALLASAKTGLQAIADAQEDVQKQFDAIHDSIDQSIDILVQTPLILALQTTQMIQSPARALTSISARLRAYGDLSESIISGDGAVVEPSLDSESSNTFRTRDLYTSTYTTGSIVSVVNNQFDTKPETIEAAESILEQFGDVVAWRDANLVSLEEIDPGGAYQRLQEAVALTAGFLVQISFTLKQERRVILDRDRSIIDLAAEFYGSVDDQLDFLIRSNNLSGSQILEVPRGSEIVYYV